jgi:hypothetical protein
MPPEDEVRFAKQRRAIFETCAEHIEHMEQTLGAVTCDGRAGLECPGGQIQEHTIRGQFMVIKRAYRNASGKRRYFEISIGHSGDEMTPVVTVLKADGETRSILFGTEFPLELTGVREAIAQQIAACLAN